MKYIKTGFYLLLQICVLTIFYFVGIFIQKITNLPIPGSIIGMILLFLLLKSKKLPLSFVEKGSKTLLTHLQLFFIPVSIGIIDYLPYLSHKGFLSLVIVFMSTLIVLVTTGWTTEKMLSNKQEDVS